MHVMVWRLHLCQLYQCNASRPNISLSKKHINYISISEIQISKGDNSLFNE